MEGCMPFNASSPYVYEAGSSIQSESCATIIGLEGRDAVTGSAYPAFAIRTFIPNCVNQSMGHVSYGGAYFKGRIECCSGHLYFDIEGTPRKRKWYERYSRILILVIGVVLLIIALIICWVIYSYFQKKNTSEDNSHPTPDHTPESVPLTTDVPMQSYKLVATLSSPEQDV
ncbi:unnamed protein product [Rotaria sp. Silwood1]|nr:unnamed protein product [Rotaria sp. Silwood1]